MKHHKLILAAAAVALAVPMMTPANAGKPAPPPSDGPNENSFGIKRSAVAQANVDLWCDNSGSTITLTDDITVGAVSTTLTLANNVKGTHAVTLDYTGDLTVKVANSYPYTVGVKAPAFGGSGGNPHFVLEMRNEDNTVATDDDGNLMQYYIGRCVAPSTHITSRILEQFPLTSTLDTLVTGVDCGSAQSDLRLQAGVFDNGLSAWVVMLNQINKGVPAPGTQINGVHKSQIQGELSAGDLIASQSANRGKGWWDADHTIHGPGGNPLVYNRPTGEAGDDAFGVFDISTESTWGLKLGRCNKL